MIPVDELRVEAIAVRGDQDVFRPQIAMQKRIGSAGLVHDLDASRRIFAKLVQPLQHARAGSNELGRHGPAKVGQRFHRADGVAQVRREEVHAVVSSAPADLRHERVYRGTRVELGDQSDGRLHAFRLVSPLERVVASVLIRVPDPVPVTLRPACQDPRTAVAEAERRQPALRNETVRLRNRRLETLQHHRADRTAADSQSVDSGFQSLEIERLRGLGGAIQHAPHEIDHLRRARFLPFLERASDPLVYVNRFAHLTRHPSPSKSTCLRPAVV